MLLNLPVDSILQYETRGEVFAPGTVFVSTDSLLLMVIIVDADSYRRVDIFRQRVVQNAPTVLIVSIIIIITDLYSAFSSLRYVGVAVVRTL